MHACAKHASQAICNAQSTRGKRFATRKARMTLTTPGVISSRQLQLLIGDACRQVRANHARQLGILALHGGKRPTHLVQLLRGLGAVARQLAPRKHELVPQLAGLIALLGIP